MTESRISVLLTASIDPKGSAFTKRSDPKTREQDYLDALRFYGTAGKRPIVFCENSGYGLAQLRAAAASFPLPTEILQFDGQTAPPERRKGYGELLIIRHALAHSAALASADYVVKITGRYRVENLDELLAPLSGIAPVSGRARVPGECDIFAMADWKPGDGSAYSALFACRPEFISRYLAPLQEELNDSKGLTFERILAKALALASADGERCIPFPAKPVVSGVSGTWDVRINPRDHKGLVLSWPELKSRFRSWRGSIMRRLHIGS